MSQEIFYYIVQSLFQDYKKNGIHYRTLPAIKKDCDRLTAMDKVPQITTDQIKMGLDILVEHHKSVKMNTVQGTFKLRKKVYQDMLRLYEKVQQQADEARKS
jgi:hypothetical protein